MYNILRQSEPQIDTEPMPSMQKAGQWIRNFIMGKEKDSKDDTWVCAASLGASPSIVPSSSKAKRRWSFKRSSSSDRLTHKSTRSFDSVLTAQLKAQASLLEFEILQTHAKAFLAARNRTLENEAAIRIQAAFRSYLARRALRALKSLVKLQALVRGHLVRKQTADTIRCLHSLLAIQLRARVQRVQMVADEEEKFPSKRRMIYKDSFSNSQLTSRPSIAEIMSSIGQEKESVYRRSLLQTRRHSVSELFQSICPSPSTSTLSEISTITLGRPQEEMSQRGPRRIIQSSSENQSYMSDTESSRAKARSQSEPRRRPKNRKHIRTLSLECLNGHNERITNTVLG